MPKKKTGKRELAAPTAPAASTTEVPVRRNKEDGLWRIADKNRRYFDGEFSCGLLSNVRFVHNAEAMACVSGYDSTGEAIGATLTRDATAMSPDAKRVAAVIYDPSARIFHVVGKPEAKVDNADWLLVLQDGSALAGWKDEVAEAA